jgi:hypothetical protein
MRSGIYTEEISPTETNKSGISGKYCESSI